MGHYGENEAELMASSLVEFWNGLKDEQILKPWPKAYKSLSTKSPYDISGMQKLLKEKMDERLGPTKGLQKKVTVGMIESPDMTYRTVDLDNI